jgi:DNA repair exonuclease SbcCD ATPase subunit
MNISAAEFDFDSPVIIVSGKSASGKSAIFDAISLCLSTKKRSSLYSDYVKQGTSHAIVKLLCQINSEPVTFNLQINLTRGTPYQMELTYKGKTFKNTEADEVLKSFDIEYYSDIIFSMQSDDYRDITQLSPTQRANYLQRLLNFDFLEQKQKLREDIDKLKTHISDIESKIHLNEQLSKKESANKETPIIVSTTLEEVSKYQKDIEAKQSKITEFQNNQNKISKLNTEIAKFSQKLMELNNKENEVNNTLADLKRKQIIINDAEEIIETNTPLIKTYESKIKELKESILLKKDEKQNLDISQDDCLNAKNAYVTDEVELLRMQSLIDEGKCPHCGQETKEHTIDLLDEFFQDKDWYDGNNLKEALDVLRSKILEISARVEENSKHMRTLEDDLRMVDKEISTNQLKHDLAVKELAKANKTIKENDLTLENQIDHTLELKNIIKEKETLKEDINAKKLDIKNLTDKYDITSFSEEIVVLNNKINGYYTDIKTNQEISQRNEKRTLAIEKYSKDLIDLEKEKTDQITQMNTFEDAFNILDKTLPNYMVVKTCTSLQNEMNNFIQTIFPNYSVMLTNSKRGCEFFYTKDRSIKEEEKKRNNAWINSKMSSGFEKALLTMSFKVSLARLYSLNLLVGDEIDGAADDESSEKLFDQLTNSSTFDQIFLISHKKNICQNILENIEHCLVYAANNGQFSLINSID